MTNKNKYIKIRLPLFCLVMMFALIWNQGAAQLTLGDNAPNLVLSSTDNSIQSFSFPYQNKIVLLFFWSSSVSKSKENIYKYKRLHTKYSDVGYKVCDGFDVISVALQSDKVAWENAINEYGLSKISNCIAQKGYSDFFIKGYKLTETPTSFLIDELGKIVAVNPSVKMVINYLDDKRNSQLNTDVQSKLSGKIMVGTTPLANEKVWLLSDKKDTLQSVMLNEKGAFLFKNINAGASYNFYMKAGANFRSGQPVFLTSENGDVISNFKLTASGYEYNLLDAEVAYLKPLFDSDPLVKKDNGVSKELYMSETLFNNKATDLSKEAMTKLNDVITKAKANPKLNIEIISHTDASGDASANLALSSKQSSSIATYLTSKGIVKARLKTIGKGESEIINKCRDGIQCQEEEHHANRRTEFKFYPAQ
jgi:outer membrane protein OmpA-like peptidoglycan-associated protein/peroxiredoxin